MDRPVILLSGQKKLQNYIDAVEDAGGIAVAEYLPEVDASYDGLILCGGGDIDPGYYHEEVDGSVNIDHARDRTELALLQAFVDAGKPVLGICRGLQLINVFFGGTLYQDLDNAREHSSYSDYDLIHPVHAEKGSVEEALYGADFTVNSYHHQAVKDLGKGLRATMKAAGSSVIEGIEHETLPVFAVQWHPERMCFSNRREDTVDGSGIFRHFVKMCK